MIAWIGFMLGAYIITRMVELLAAQVGMHDSKLVRGLAFTTVVIASFTMWVMFVGPSGAFPKLAPEEIERLLGR